jgi:hypothetical protein
MSIATVHEVSWQALPYQPVARAATITGRSQAHVYKLIKLKLLRAVKLGSRPRASLNS